MTRIAQEATNSGPCGLWRKNQNERNLHRLDTDELEESMSITSYHRRRCIHIVHIGHAGWHGEHVHVAFRS